MDARENFPMDMVEQMLKFTPTPEERAMLDEHAEEMEHLARADRYFVLLFYTQPTSPISFPLIKEKKSLTLEFYFIHFVF